MTLNRGILYIVATPIGNLADISRRAVEILSTVDLIAAEDTRHTGRLLQHLNISNKLMALHDHNERKKISELINHLNEGKSVALVSDAGTPLISDPGYALVRQVTAAGFKVSPIPGACAFIAALSASGIATDSFIFEGFLPAKKQARCKQLKSLKNETRSLVFYESTHRILDCLIDMEQIFGDNREITVARELTKTFETIYNGELSNIIQWMKDDPNQSRGEFVVIVSGNELAQSFDEMEADRIVDILCKKVSITQATSLASEITGERKKALYQRALERKEQQGG